MNKSSESNIKKQILQRFEDGYYSSPGVFLLEKFEFAIKKLLRSKSNISDFYLYVVWWLATLLLGLSISLVLNEQALWSLDLLVGEIYMLTVSTFILVASKWFFVDFRRKIVPRILEATEGKANLIRFVEWADAGYRLRQIALPLFLTWVVLILNSPEVNNVPVATTSVGSFLIMAIVSVPSSIGVFLLIWGVTLPLQLRKFDFDLYRNNPAKSFIVQFFLEKFSNYALYVALINALITLVYVLVGSVSFQTRLLLVVAAWLPLSVFFVSIHWSLYVIVKRHKRQTLLQLEQAARPLAKRHDPISLQKLHAINEQYEAVLNAPDSTINLVSILRFFSALIIQLPSVFLNLVS